MKKITLAIVLVLLLILSACQSGGLTSKLDDTAEYDYFSLPLSAFDWSLSLSEAQELYPEHTVSKVGTTDSQKTTILIVKNQNFGELCGYQVDAIELRFAPVLNYDGIEYDDVLTDVMYHLADAGYEDVLHAAKEKYGEGQNGVSVLAKKSYVWQALKGLKDLDAKTAALTLALNPSPNTSANVVLFSGDFSNGVPSDAIDWPGVDFEDEQSCMAVRDALNEQDSTVRTISLSEYDSGVFIEFHAGNMAYWPIAEDIFNSK